MTHAQKLDLIDRVINRMVTDQLKEMEQKLRAQQSQANQLQYQYGKVRPIQVRGQGSK
ncbi:MAG: hypothetical protein BroJett011_76170 [Chloroflexota bacterium]|nr:MAG: hypothetical protein BroJett011_76170 [Chloroflexota bacterium]